MNATLPASRTSLGAAEVDHRLGGGLVVGGLHEIHCDEDDCGAANGFALLLALRAAATRPIIVIRDDRCIRAFGRLYGDGVAALGGDPATITMVHGIGTLPTLRAAADAVACPAVGAVIVEPWRAAAAFDLTASRRLAMRAERVGVFALLVRLGGVPPPSAAATRWRVRSAPSRVLAANAPGPPAFDITLLRHRGGVAGFDARVEWNHDQRNFCDAPLSRGVPAVAAGGAGGAGQRCAA